MGNEGPGSNEGNGLRRLPYERPDLRVVSLVSAEVLAVGCKPPLPPGGGFAPPNCPASKCIGPGS